ncbi:hypothetical protein OV450_3397 [Actinobacteria bacterium OV450]|nr:hypothetical protein OV450_3397 [Actinobacteria bacterium OV450]
MTPEELLLAAADDIAVHGHHKGALYAPRDRPRDTARACALGALTRRATHISPSAALSVHRAAIQFLCNQIPDVRDPKDRFATESLDNTYKITAWNDHPQTSKKDVILAMQKAANHDA